MENELRRKACLVGAGFIMADLAETNFNNANLMGANFTKSKMRSADFKSANLTGVDFSESVFFNGVFFGSYIQFNQEKYLPKTPDGYKFEFDSRVEGDKHYIRLVKTDSKPKSSKTKKLKPTKIKKLP